MKWLCPIALCLVFAIPPAARAGDQQTEDKDLFGHYSFRGRLVAVLFEDVKNEDRDRMVLQFRVEEAFALVIDKLPALVNVRTSTLIDLKSLNEADYFTKINEGLPDNIRLGGQCLVATHWSSGGFGRHVLDEVRPATPEAEREFLRDHRTEIVYHECSMAHARAASYRNLVLTARSNLRRQLRLLEADGLLGTETGDEIVQPIRKALSDTCDTASEDLSKLRDEFKTRADRAKDKFEREKSEWVVEECERSLSEIRKICSESE